MIVVKHYFWLSAITSKVIKFTTIETTYILAFLTTVFLTLALISITTCFYSSLTIFGTLCSLHCSLRYESLIYRLLSVKSIFFKLNMTNNIIKCLDIVIIGKINMHVFLIAWQREDKNLDLLFISHLMPSTP